MARAESASASAHSDSIKGLAQAVARPAYRRLLTAEPFLRRAVPVLIIAFLFTLGIAAVVVLPAVLAPMSMLVMTCWDLTVREALATEEPLLLVAMIW